MGRKTIIKQIDDRFRKMFSNGFGQSKADAKAEKYNYLKSHNLKCDITELVINQTIFSIKTFENYSYWGRKFGEYTREEFGARHIKDINLEMATSFIQKLKDEGKAPHTLKLARSALAKLLDCKGVDILENISNPSLPYSRSRENVKSDRHFKEFLHEREVLFAKGTGLRRRELEHVTAEKIVALEDGRVFIRVPSRKNAKKERISPGRSKGDKDRSIEVLPEFREHILLVKHSIANPKERIFKNLNKHMDVHSYRAWFAGELYRQLAKPTEEIRGTKVWNPSKKKMMDAVYTTIDGKEFDRAALLEVSKRLGHNRESVVVKNYSYLFSKSE